MITIRQAFMPEDRAPIAELFTEYIRWVCPRIYEEYQAVFDAESIILHDMETIGIFMPPEGLLFLAMDGATPAGCACVRTIGEQVAELKRMYVRPAFRRQGIGRSLVQASVEAVRSMQYSRMRLDSAGFMGEAHALYRSFGFRDIAPYEGSEIPVEYRRHWVFMELAFAGTGWRSKMDVTLRPGALSDASALKNLDTVIPLDPTRAGLIDQWLREDTVIVAELDGQVAGYGVFNHGFFHQAQVEMLMVHPGYRGRQIGAQLLEALEQQCAAAKLFVTTNLSNHRMQRLLARREYAPCGYIDELDPGDPELVFVKKLPG